MKQDLNLKNAKLKLKVVLKHVEFAVLSEHSNPNEKGTLTDEVGRFCKNDMDYVL